MWVHGIIPSFVLAVVISLWQGHVRVVASEHGIKQRHVVRVFGRCRHLVAHLSWLRLSITSFCYFCCVCLRVYQLFRVFLDPFNLFWTFSEVLEPVALVPQLLVFRGCTDAGRLACELSNETSCEGSGLSLLLTGAADESSGSPSRVMCRVQPCSHICSLGLLPPYPSPYLCCHQRKLVG